MSGQGEGCPANDREYSIVIPGHGCAELIRRRLEAITESTLSAVDYGVVVVDNGSKGSGGELLAHLDSPFRSVRHTEDPGSAKGRNAEARAAR